MPESATDNMQLKLRKGGELTITEDGQRTVIAKYDEKTGHLEFATRKDSEKFYTQAVSVIGTTNDGKEVSGKIVRSFGVKGEERKPIAKDAPKRPRLGPLGDSDKDFVQWMLDNDMPQAIIRYGIYVDAKGEIVRRKVRRIFETMVDNRDMTDRNLKPVADGNASEMKAPVVRGMDMEDTTGIIARRATALTFHPSEVIGGFVPEDDDFDNTQEDNE